MVKLKEFFKNFFWESFNSLWAEFHWWAVLSQFSVFSIFLESQSLKFLNWPSRWHLTRSWWLKNRKPFRFLLTKKIQNLIQKNKRIDGPWLKLTSKKLWLAPNRKINFFMRSLCLIWTSEVEVASLARILNFDSINFFYWFWKKSIWIKCWSTWLKFAKSSSSFINIDFTKVMS